MVFYKSCNLIGSESGQYSPHPARSQRAVSDSLRDEITSIASLQLFIYQIDTYRINFSLFTANINFFLDSDHSESEFYYPDEVEKFSDKENIGSQRKENQQKVQFTMASVQKKHGEKNRIRLTRLEKILS